MSYIDSYLLPVPKANLDAYRVMTEGAGKIWMEHGALAYTEGILDAVDSKLNRGSFSKAAAAVEGQTVAIAFVVFKSREHRDEVSAKVYADPRIAGCDGPAIFDMNRQINAGFKVIANY